uniref:Protein kinase domain-containing protein n=2 Tax=Schistosoma mansoni TaxID=6183 RepID=A0A3Q0KPQ4_SCHMA
MTSSSMSLFTLSYLGHSTIQKSNDCELETIYELLIDYYLEFLRQISSSKLTASSVSSNNHKTILSYKSVMTENYDSVILAIGNGHILIKSLDYKGNKRKDDKFKNSSVMSSLSSQVDEDFLAYQLIYFNCYYFEVVTPVGSNISHNSAHNGNNNKNRDHCYAYFRRIIDTRRCIPEDALIKLDNQITSWLLRYRTVLRPPLIYFMVPRLSANGENCLTCYVFLAEDIQIGLNVLRCFSELRKSSPGTNILPRTLCKCDALKPIQSEAIHYQSKRMNDKLNTNKYENSKSDYLNVTKYKHCECCQDYLKCRESPLLSERATRSHIDLLQRLNNASTSEPSMNAVCSQCNLKYYPVHSNLCEQHRSKVIQMKLGIEAMDYYYNNHSQYQQKRNTNSEISKPNNRRRDYSVPTQLECRVNHTHIDPYNQECPLCPINANSDFSTSEHIGRPCCRYKINERTRSSNRTRQSCSASRYFISRSRDNPKYCHAHLGGSLELLP